MPRFLSLWLIWFATLGGLCEGNLPLSNFFQEKISQHGPGLEADVNRIVGFVQQNYAELFIPREFIAITHRNANVSSTCSNDVLTILENVWKKQVWALQFLDAFGKPETGLLNGNLAWLGSFGECQASAAVLNNQTEFQGKYCLASIGPHRSDRDAPVNPESPALSLALRLGLCFPDTCSDVDAHQLLLNLFTIAKELANVTRLELYSTTCQPRSYKYDTKAIVTFVVIAIFAFFLATGTLFDIVVYQPRLKEVNLGETLTRTENDRADNDDSPLLLGPQPISLKERIEAGIAVLRSKLGILGEILLVFSLYSNARKILSTSHTDQSLACVHGIRFFSMTWVLLGHSYAFVMFVVRNVSVVPVVLGDFWFQVIVNGTVSVDTFFTMSGLLVAYLFLLNYKKTERIPFVGYYLHRYWRLTAAYGLVMLIYLSFFKYLNSGPQWNPNGMEVDSCRSSWWTNLLYINNFVNTDKQCMGWTWYLANDMQFYWISPLVLIPLVKIPRLGLGVMLSFFIAHITTTAVLSSHYALPPSMLGNGLTINGTTMGADLWLYFDKYYSKPWTRIGPYLIGMMCGYLLIKYRDEKITMRKDVCALLWALATATSLAVVYGLYGMNNGHPLSPAAAALYNTLHRNGWALAVCWVIFACVQGYGGFVNTILSWKILIPLSRLTYCCYLIHIPVLMVFYLGKTTEIDFSHLETVYYFFGTLAITYGFAFLFTVSFESPLMGLEKVLTRKRDLKTTQLQ